MIFELIYQSYAAYDFSSEELIDLCKQAQAKNKQLDITGCLVHVNGEFAQLLEGEKEAVQALYHTIRHDGRHHGVFLIHEGATPTRSFTDWSMGLQEYDSIAAFNNDPNLPLRPLDSLSEIKSDASFARKMFAQFSLKGKRPQT
jgi:hypothetical protein